MIFPLKLQLNGSVTGNLKLFRKSKQSKVSFEVKTSNDLIIRNFILDNQNAKIKKPLQVVLSADEVKFKSETVVNEEGVFLSSGAVKLNESEFKAFGSVTGENGFDLDMTGNVNLKDLKKLAAFEIEGAGPLHWTVKSKGKSVIFGFDAELENARYLDLHLGKTAGRVLFDDDTGVLTFENLKTTQGKLQCVANGTINLSDTDKVDIDIDIPTGTIQDFAKVFSTFINRSVTWYPYELTGQLNGKMKVSGKTDMNALSVLGDLTMANVDYHYEIFREGRMRAGFVAGDYIAENFEIQKKKRMVPRQFQVRQRRSHYLRRAFRRFVDLGY